MRQIKIHKTKNIKNLSFNIPENNDVYLLVGANGSGKTTLLTCLDRICNPYAFAKGFTSASNTANIDQYSSSSIEYITNDTHIKFKKGTRRWASTPRIHSSTILKEKFGFTDSIFIEANSKRIDIPQEEIQQGDLMPVDQAIITSLNAIFETQKYNDLFRLRNTHGRGRNITYFYVLKDGSKYFSEKRFSTGELAVLRLIDKIHTASPNSLILLDEAEMALHPRIQKNLLDYLTTAAQTRNLMVIISTHSVTMIKATSRHNIMLLEKDRSGNTIVSTPCYSSKAIGYVDFESNVIFDTIFFVEDEMARLILQSMIETYSTLRPETSTMRSCIIPVGGYEQTATLAKNTRRQLFSSSKVFAFLDDDVFTESIHENDSFRQLYEENEGLIFSLKCTPESWLIHKLENNDPEFAEQLRIKFHCEIPTILNDPKYLQCNSPKPRKLCKQKVVAMLSIIKDWCGDSEEIIIKNFIDLLFNQEINNTLVLSALGPALNR